MPSDAFTREVYAAVTDDVLLVLLTISHPDLTDDIRVVNNTENITSSGDEYLAVGFDIQLPDDEAKREPRATIRIDGVAQELTAHLRSVNSAVAVSFGVIRAATPDVIERTYPGFKLRNVEIDALTVSGELTLDDLVIEPFPAHAFVPATFPGLFA